MWKAFVDWLTFTIMGLLPKSQLGSAVNFFIYDAVKIFFLLAVIVFVVAIIRTFLPPERTKKTLAKVPEYMGNLLAAVLGIVTPFCSCSAVPLFIGFIESGVPLGVTFSFLVASPVINEVALILLWGLFGWRVAVLYIVSGLVIATVSGIIIGCLRLESWVEDYVYQLKVGESEVEEQTWRQRLGLCG